ncbi:MAG: hypothetical protein Q9163_003110 [Psora crenata]
MLCRATEISLWTLNGAPMLEQNIYVEGDDMISSCAFFEGNGNEALERQLIFTGHTRGVVNVWSVAIRGDAFVLEHVKRMDHMDQAGFNIGASITAILPMAQVVYTGDEDGRVVVLRSVFTINGVEKMPTPGYVFKDGGPIPDSELEVPRNQEPGTQVDISSSNSSTLNNPTVSPTTLDIPSESHALANVHHEEKGAAQMPHREGEVCDMGWHEHSQDVPRPLVGGLPNEELWTLIRRFNKQIYYVKATNDPLLGGLDLNVVKEDEFSPDKLRSNVERLYMTVIIGIISLGKHIARLRSWREPKRTAAFCAVSWSSGYSDAPTYTPTGIYRRVGFQLLNTLGSYHSYSAYPIPTFANDFSPKAGVLGSHGSVTGAPENHHGEAVEQEAHNFITGIGTIALSSAAGKHENNDSESDPVGEPVPDPTRIASAAAEAKVSVKGADPSVHHDKTKQPMEDVMWKKMRPVMHIIGDLADGWERFANALSPTKPFPQEKPRLILAGVVAPLLAVSLLTSSAMFMKIVTGGVGFGFFGDPLIWRGLDYLNKKVPNWQKLLELRNSILKGVPTNAQLTITLLRIGEANRAPLPPPPTSEQPPSSKPASLNAEELPLDTSHEELEEAIQKGDDQRAAENEAAQEEKQKHRHGGRILGFFKGTTNAGVETKFGVDKARAKVLGSAHAKNHLGVLPKNTETQTTGPVDFKARYKGDKGWVYISTNTTIPSVSFSYSSTDATGQEPEKAGAKWSVPVHDIKELKKVGGLGWKSKIVVGWATGKTVADGLEIVDRKGATYKLTAIRMREELFNRLISIGNQKWESW